MPSRCGAIAGDAAPLATVAGDAAPLATVAGDAAPLATIAGDAAPLVTITLGFQRSQIRSSTALCGSYNSSFTNFVTMCVFRVYNTPPLYNGVTMNETSCTARSIHDYKTDNV